MKLIARTLTILAAALVVVGIAFSIGQSGGMSSSNAERPMPPEFAQTSDTGTSTQTMPMRGEHNESASLFGIVEIVKNLVIISIIVAVVSGISRWLRRHSPRVSGPRPHAPPA